VSKHHSLAEYEAAITASRGLVAAAARRLGVSRQAVYKAVQRWPELGEVVDDQRAELLDLAESKVYAAVARGNLKACCWVLDRLGKDRGYSTRVEVHDLGLSARELAALSDADLEVLARELN
jgi:transposase